jgi:AcrR family transcriptional regulator
MNDRDTRHALILAGEQLFAAQGIDGPSLREITRAAGQHNTSALQYHFDDREKLVQAVLQRHNQRITANRDALLDEAEAADDHSLRRLAAALVLPLVAQLENRDGGSEYLQIAGEIYARPRHFAPIVADLTELMARWSKEVEPHLPPQAVGRPLHRRFAAVRFTYGELASRARERSRRDHHLFSQHLIDLVTALLAAPVSDETLVWIRPKSQ